MSRADLGPRALPRKPSVVSWGELLWDLFPDCALLGGAAANVSYHAALLGAESWLVSAVGADSLGRRAIERLEKVGVVTRAITVDATRKTGRVRVTFENGEPHFEIEEAVAWDGICPSNEVLERIRSSDAFCFSTLAQRTPLMRSRLRLVLQSIDAAGHAAPFGGAKGRRPLCIADLNLRPPFTQRNLILEILEHADVVKVNDAEAQFLKVTFGADDAVDWLFSHFPARLVVITRGARGASLHSRHTTSTAAGLAQRGGDPVGAGDAFVAALAVSLGSGNSPPRALEQANRHGAWVAGRSGAMPAGPPPSGSRASFGAT